MIKPLYVITGLTTAAFGIFSSFAFSCLNFNNNNVGNQEDKVQTKEYLGLDNQQLMLLCNGAYFIQILLEVATVLLILRSIADYTAFNPNIHLGGSEGVESSFSGASSAAEYSALSGEDANA